MGIHIKKQNEEITFFLETKNTLYQIKADQYKVLKHIWYGSKTNGNMEYLLDYPDVGFSGNIDEVKDDRTYSLDTLPQEYSTFGVGDYRISSVAAKHEDGSIALDLRYEDYSIEKGKYSIPGLPAVYALENEADTLSITLKDTASNILIILKYGVLEDLDIITRSVVIKNKGTSPITLTNAASLCLDIPYGDYDWIHFHGRHTMERVFERTSLIHGIQESSSTRGTSSHQQNPSVIICSKDCTETNGECFGAALMYSGSFKTQIEVDQLNQTRLVMGINPDLFSWELKEQEEFYTPEVILSFSSTGLETLSHNFHKVIRNNVCRGKYKLINRPVLINNWEATYFDFDEEKIYNIAKEAAKLGVDMMVLDDGWFGKRGSDTSGLGDWFVNENKLHGGLKKLVDKINDLGMKFGIWFEPEMISEDSNLYREHPDWAIKMPNRKPNRSRCQLLIDMTNPEVIDYLYDCISKVLTSANVTYIKWDFNRSISDWYTDLLPSERQNEMPHRFVLGLYELLERLNKNFPDVLFEGCSGGGGRFDAGMMYYTPQIWCSDDTDAYERTKIQYGTSFFYPISTVGSHVSAVPNHQTGRITSIDARATVAMAGSFGYELDLNKITEEEKDKVKEQIKTFKKYNSLIHNGTYYRLSNPTNDKYAIWEFVSEDKKEILVQGIIFRTEPNMLRYPIKLRGIEENYNYTLDSDNVTYTGGALLNGGILLPKSWGDYVPINLHFTLFEEEQNQEEKKNKKHIHN